MRLTSDPVDDDVDVDPPSPERVERQRGRRLIAAALGVGVVVESGLRGGATNAVVSIGAVLIVVLLWTGARLPRRGARVLAAAAVLPAAFLAFRASAWLAWSNAVALVALLVLAVLYARHGSILDSTPAQVARRSRSGLAHGVAGLEVVRVLQPSMSDGWRDRVVRLGRGLLVVVPVVVVLLALLASADAVFASLLTPELDLRPAVGHGLLALVVALVVLALVGASSAERAEPGRRGTFGVIEVTAMLGVVAAVLALFVLSQLVALTVAGDRLVESAGLTPAEYARSGFFQLCWAAGLLLGFLALVRAVADPVALRSRVVVALGTAVPLLALGLVLVSLRRMALYDDAFGLTILRLWVVGAALWMGVVLLMTAARNAGIGSGRQWLVAGAGLAAGVLLMAANGSNPEAFVARHNLERAHRGAELDVGYLATLSDDAVPVVADAVDAEADPIRRKELLLALGCGDGRTGVASLNLAVVRASEARDERCPT